MLVALSKLIYQICHLFSMCASALPHLSWNYIGHDTNRKKKKKNNPKYSSSPARKEEEGAI